MANHNADLNGMVPEAARITGIDVAIDAMRDAERYRWLKANHLQTGPDSWIRTGDDLEEAIDAGMEASARPQLPAEGNK